MNAGRDCSQNPQLRGSMVDSDKEPLGQAAKTGQGKETFVLKRIFALLRSGEAGNGRIMMFSEHLTRTQCYREQHCGKGSSRVPTHHEQ